MQQKKNNNNKTGEKNEVDKQQPKQQNLFIPQKRILIDLYI